MISPDATGELQFVPFREEHLAAIMAIEVEAYPEPWTEGMFRDEMRNKLSRFYSMMTDTRLIGYGGFWLVLDEAHITSVTIDKEFQGLGLGRTLMSFLLDTAIAAGARLAALEVRESNLRARNLYLSMGFRPVGIRKNYYSKSLEDAIVMLKEMT